MTDKRENIGNIFVKRREELEMTKNEIGISHGKELVEYVVAAINEFAKRYFLTLREASNYLLRFKGIEFLEQCYAAEHTLSVNAWIEDITEICKRNGGEIG